MGVYIIAEAGVNHNGSLQTALALVDAAADAGADAVKFQTFKAERLVRRNAPKADYQKQTTGSDETQYEMLSRLELPFPDHEKILERCEERGIDFLSSPFDEKSLDFLVDCFGLKTVKFGSGEITNAPLLLRAAKKNVSLLLSTGMSTLGEIEAALSCLAFGYLGILDSPSLDRFLQAYASPSGREVLEEKVTLLHCTSEYPAPEEDVNLRAIGTLRSAFGLPIGYSDHTAGTIVAAAAATLGASVVEKHLTLDRTLSGPDHRASLPPDEFGRMVQQIRTVEKALGSARKTVSLCEWDNRRLVRKSLVAKKDISRGEIIQSEHLEAKRPGEGISPMEYWGLLGTSMAEPRHEGENI
ncbi:MAG: N-acetylneuraminate synthase [Synergistaceae bacterium]|nr:N-acetylneuraminate synthase [Synergistaceae bacterium]